jgi:hypothetical protein
MISKTIRLYKYVAVGHHCPRKRPEISGLFVNQSTGTGISFGSGFSA